MTHNSNTNQITSPCIRQCKLVEGVCEGCGRSMLDIVNWKNYSEDKRKSIIENISNNL